MNRILFFVFLITFSISSAYGEKNFFKNPTPYWVHEKSFDPLQHLEEEQKDAGLCFLIIDSQDKLEKENLEMFRHIGVKLLSEDALEAFGSLQFTLDPSYQKLIFHHLYVYKNGQKTDRLKIDNIQSLQREENLDKGIYNGEETALIILDDLEIGDIVEYSVSLVGKNPALEGAFAADFCPQGSSFIKESYKRILHSPDITLFSKACGTQEPEKIVREDSWVEYIHHQKDLSRLLVDSNLPRWYDPFPRISWSELASYKEIANWAYKFFQKEAEESEQIQKIISRIEQEEPDPKNQILQAIRYVQEKIRYTGIEIGEKGYIPADPSQTALKKYGDCKDKSCLLVFLLKNLGFEAYPVLVNTYLGEYLEKEFPQSTMFNHAIVLLVFEGKNYWIDPTEQQQGGDFEHFAQAYFGQALVLREGEETLTPMSHVALEKFNLEINEAIDFSKGESEPAKYRIEKIYRGEVADYIRSQIANYGKSYLRKRQQEIVEELYPSAQSSSEMKIADDFETNTVVFTLEFNIDKFIEENNGEKALDVFPIFFFRNCHIPSEARRKTPIAYDYHKYKLKNSILLQLPSNYTIEDSVLEIKDSAFLFKQLKKKEGEAILFESEFIGLQDFVDGDKISEHCKNLQKLRKSLGASWDWDEVARKEKGKGFFQKIFSFLGAHK